MARVTIEDCLKTVTNRFDLVLVASKRAHQLNSGTHRSILDVQNDKSSVVALREIAQNLIDKSIINESYDTQIHASGISMAEVEEELSQTATEESKAQSTNVSSTKE